MATAQSAAQSLSWCGVLKQYGTDQGIRVEDVTYPLTH
jgi:hypothetical protein